MHPSNRKTNLHSEVGDRGIAVYRNFALQDFHVGYDLNNEMTSFASVESARLRILANKLI